MDTTAIGLNIIDLIMVVIIAAIISIGFRNGIMSEFVQLLGIFCTIFVTLHYYERFADFLRVQFLGKDALTEFLAFIILGVLFLVIFVLIGKGWVLILKVDFSKSIDRYGGAALSLARSYFTCGLVFFALLLANHNYLTPETQRSVSSVVFRNVAVDCYRAAYSTFIEKYFGAEPFNAEVFKMISTEKKQKKK